MANKQISKLLEFANMQMAAEAFLSRIEDASPNLPPAVQVRDRLVEGNTHASKFVPSQAEQFAARYEVLAQYRNDPLRSGGAGFSGTLFKNRQTGELTLSFRSTEFIDDAIRDAKATSDLEVKDLGWALGQIAEMETWYQDLRSDSALLAGKTFYVTGYSLGGHLATAFNILRREEYAAAPQFNPVIGTYTFNGAGTGEVVNVRLTDLVADFNRIRANYAASSEWMNLPVGDQNAYLDLAQRRVDAIVAERARVAGLPGAQSTLFRTSGPPGNQILLSYQIAALLVGRNTVGALDANPPTVGGSLFVSSNLKMAPAVQQFSNMTEVVGMEQDGQAISFVSNSGIHYGTRMVSAIEAQPLYRGAFPVQAADSVKLLVANPERNNFADTHSLALLVDSLSLLAAIETLDTAFMLETAREIFNASSNTSASALLFTQGKAEGDSLERMLDAARNLILGPDQQPTLDYKSTLIGNTWHLTENRGPFHKNIETLTEAIGDRGLIGTVSILPTSGLSQLTLIEGANAVPDAPAEVALAYRYALLELNPFIAIGDAGLYALHNLSGGLEFYEAAHRTGRLTANWIADRAEFLKWKNVAYFNNTTNLQNALSADSWRYVDIPRKVTISVAGAVSGGTPDSVTHRAIFGGERPENLTGGTREDRIYGGGGADYIEGKGSNDYLEGGSGRDIYSYTAENVPLFPNRNDGLDAILDTDGDAVLRYVYRDGFLSGWQSAVIAGVGINLSGTQWNSVDGRFNYSIAPGNDERTNLQVTISGQTGARIDLTDYRDNDFGIALRSGRNSHAYAPVGPVLNGDDAPNTLSGNAFADLIQGLGATDVLSGNAGDDLILGGFEGDFLFGNEGFDRLLGEEGRDQLFGGADDDELFGGADSDYFEGGAGDDRLAGDAGRDIVIGNEGNDEIYAGNSIYEQAKLGSYVVEAETQKGTGLQGDWLEGDEGKDILVGDRDNDLLVGGGEADILVGGAGDDNLAGDADGTLPSFDWLVRRLAPAGGAASGGTYRLEYLNGSVIESPDGAGDELRGGAGADWLFGGLGKDVLYGDTDADILFGQQDADVLVGGSGNDILVGDDPGVISGTGEGADYLDGGAGDDTLQANGGDDILIGGAGSDALHGGAGKDTYFFNAGDGADVIFDDSTGPEKSEIIYGEGFDKTKLKIRKGSLILDFGNGDTTRFVNFDVNDPNAIPAFETLHFADGITMGFDEVIGLGFDLDGTEGDDNGQTAGRPILAGTAYTDRIRGHLGSDFLAGLQGNDILDGGEDSDRLQGDEGNDVLSGAGGNDVLFGGLGDDTLEGGTGFDFLNGGDENDTYFFDPQDSVLDFAGRETIAFGEEIKPEDVDLSIQTINGQPVRFIALAGEHPLHSGMGITLGLDGLSRTVSYRFSGDLVLTEEEFFRSSRIDSQMFSGSGDDDLIFGYAGVDLLQGMDGDDLLFGGRGDDRLEGGEGNDTLDAGRGSDRLFGGAGDDIFVGGAGDDQLLGQAGSDVYQFFRGDGRDVVSDGGGIEDTDTLYLGDANREEVILSRDASGDLRVDLAGSEEGVTVSGYFNSTENRIEHIEFADGSVVESAELDALIVLPITGSGGNDVLTGTQNDDTLLGLEGDDDLNGGHGNDEVRGGAGSDQLTGGGGVDQLVGGAGVDTYGLSLASGVSTLVEDGAEQSIIRIPVGLKYSDLAARRSGDDLVIDVRDTQSSTVILGYYAGQTNWTVTTSTGESRTLVDLVAYLEQIARPITIAELEQTYLQDARRKYQIYLDKSGASGDVIVNEQPLSDAQNISRLAPFGETEQNGEFFLNVARITAGDSANIVHLGSRGVNIVDSGGGDDLIYNRGFGFVDGTNNIGSFLYGNDGNDQIVGTFNTDVIIGGAGNDYLNGDDGSDLFHIDPSQAGIDLIDEVTDARLSPAFTTFAAGTADKVLFGGGLTPEDLTLSWDGFSYTDLSGIARTRPTLNMQWSADQGVRVVVPQAGDHSQAGIEHFEFADGTTWTLNQFIALAPQRPNILGGQLNDFLFGTFLNDTIFGGAGNDHMHADAGNDVLDGGAGDDTLDGWFGNDTFLFGFESGRDVILPGPILPPPPPLPGLPFPPLGPASSDMVKFLPGVDAGDVVVQKTGTDLVVSLKGSADRITIQNWFFIAEVSSFVFADGSVWNLSDIHGKLPVTTVVGTEGNDFISGTPGRDEIYGLGGDDSLAGSGNPDLLDGGSGNDVLLGGGGSDTYLFGRGYGRDRIDASGSALDEIETIRLASDISPSDLDIRFDNSTLFLGVGSIDQLTLSGALNNPSRISYQLAFADGTVWDMKTAVANGTLIDAGTNDQRVDASGIDNIYAGGAGDDLLDGGIGSDWLDGGVGADMLRGGVDEDIYVFGRGYGNDTIEQGAGDILRLLPGVAPSDIGLTRHGPDLRISINDAADSLAIRGWYGVSALGQVVFENGLAWNADTLSQLTASLVNNVHGTEAEDQLSGTPGVDFIRGAAGSDNLFGDTGDDILDGGQGDDRLAGASGADTYIFERGDGHDEIVDFDPVSGAVDVLRFGNGIAPDDVAVAQGPYNELHISIAGTPDRLDISAFDERWGLERIEFADGSSWDGAEIPGRLSTGIPTQFDDALGGVGSNDRIDALGGSDIVYGGEGDDILYGGAGNDDVVDWAGDNLVDGGSGDDYLFVNAAPNGVTSSGSNFIIGGPGNDLIDSFGTSNVIAFNAGDGQDVVYAWDNLTISLGGGIQMSSLTLGKDGSDLVLSLGGEDSIRFSRPFTEDPEAWPQITLQLFGSVHIFDFTAVIGKFYEAFAVNPSLESFSLGDVLPLHETSFSETQALGDALAYQYGTQGTLDAIDDDAIRQILQRETFGTEPESIAIEVPNQMPVLVNPIGDRLVLEDTSLEFQLPVDTFTDVEPDGVRELTASLSGGALLPDWIVFDANPQLFRVSPSNDDVGAVDVTVTATDSSGLSVNDTFRIEVAGTNDAPTVVNPLADQSIEAGQLFAWTISDDAVSDPDAGDSVQFAAALETGSPLPSWLQFDAESRIFTAAPSQDDAGVIKVQVVASDKAGATASDTFEIAVTGRVPGMVIVGTPRDDLLSGDSLDDTIWGRRGDDTLYGNAGNDLLLGEEGKDFIDGGEGDDLVGGGDGHDEITGGSGRNVLIGGKGHDQIRSGGDTDLILMNLGDGKDQISSSSISEATALDVLSLGGGAAGGNVSLRRAGYDLLVEAGVDEKEGEGYARAILKDWYAGDGDHQTLAALQIIESSVPSVFDFVVLTRRFDEAHQHQTHTGRWYVGSVLPDVEVSTGEALGGQQALAYAETGELPGIDHPAETADARAQQPIPEVDESGLIANFSSDYRKPSGDEPEPANRRGEQQHKLKEMPNLLDGYLSNQPLYDFELVAREMERSNQRERALSNYDILRRWHKVARYSAESFNENDDNHAGSIEGKWRIGQDRLDEALGGRFGHSGSTGEIPGIGPLKGLQGLTEGFSQLN